MNIIEECVDNRSSVMCYTGCKVGPVRAMKRFGKLNLPGDHRLPGHRRSEQGGDLKDRPEPREWTLKWSEDRQTDMTYFMKLLLESCCGATLIRALHILSE